MDHLDDAQEKHAEPPMNSICPCHSGKMYHECCQPYHEGHMPATALLLMRSRYAGYALGLADYIIETTHHSNPSCQLFRERWRKEIVAFSKNTAFEGLTIVEVIEGFDTAR